MDRLGEQLREELALLLIRGEVADPRLQTVSLHAVRVTHDLSHARVFWSFLLPGEDSAANRTRTQRALDRAAPFLRGRLAKDLQIRQMPALEFLFDVSLETGRRIDGLLHDLTIPTTDGDPEDTD